MEICQEKLQISAKGKTEAGEEWASVDSVQHHVAQTHLQMPTTYIDAATQKNMKLVLAGSTDVTNTVEPEDLKRGHDLHPMLMYDDQYTCEHQDQFYDDVGGFVERANMLDRM